MKHNYPDDTDTDNINSRQTVIISLLHTFKRLMEKLSRGIDEIKEIKLIFYRQCLRWSIYCMRLTSDVNGINTQINS